MRGIAIDGPYSAMLLTNIEAQQQARSTIPATVLARSSLAETSDGGGGFTINVPEGTPVLMAGQGNWQDGMVSGSWLQLYRPDGTLVETVTATNAAGLMVIPAAPGSPAGAILCALIINPEPGTWTVSYDVEDGAPDVELTAGAMPAQNAAQVMSEEVARILQHAAESDARTSWGCMGCKVAAYALALGITVAVAAASTVILTVDSAVVVATAGFLGCTAAAALALVAGLIAGGTVTVDFVLTNLCQWANLC